MEFGVTTGWTCQCGWSEVREGGRLGSKGGRTERSGPVFGTYPNNGVPGRARPGRFTSWNAHSDLCGECPRGAVVEVQARDDVRVVVLGW